MSLNPNHPSLSNVCLEILPQGGFSVEPQGYKGLSNLTLCARPPFCAGGSVLNPPRGCFPTHFKDSALPSGVIHLPPPLTTVRLSGPLLLVTPPLWQSASTLNLQPQRAPCHSHPGEQHFRRWLCETRMGSEDVI